MAIQLGSTLWSVLLLLFSVDAVVFDFQVGDRVEGNWQAPLIVPKGILFICVRLMELLQGRGHWFPGKIKKASAGLAWPVYDVECVTVSRLPQ